MHASNDLGRVALHPVQRRVREDGVVPAILLEAVELVTVAQDPADGAGGGRRQGGRVGLGASEQVGRGVEADDGATGEDGRQDRLERELARAAAEVEDVLLQGVDGRWSASGDKWGREKEEEKEGDARRAWDRGGRWPYW